jgi:1-deoxy-D-xylulose-5-phosphate synthase
LGVVELTLALYQTLDLDHDKVVWDVGHQAYPHKLITGRYATFHTLRQQGGVAGYLKRSESRFDHFGAGHASTSISAALGMALARDRRGEDFRCVAVIGDGSLTGGMALEAINHAGHLPKTRLLVVLNDNDMSISPPVGALSTHLNRMRQQAVAVPAGQRRGGDQAPAVHARRTAAGAEEPQGEHEAAGRAQAGRGVRGAGLHLHGSGRWP